MPERVQGAVVTPSLFPILGVQPIKGRVFNDSEVGDGNDGVVIVSERLWRRRFNSDPQLVGQQLAINGRSFTVVGIMPSAFEFPLPLFGIQGGTFAERADIWKPVAFTQNEMTSRGSRKAMRNCDSGKSRTMAGMKRVCVGFLSMWTRSPMGSFSASSIAFK